MSCTITETPDIPSSKSHVHFSMNWLLQSIHPSLSPCVTFHNMLVLYNEQFLSLTQCRSWWTMPWRLPANAYSVYSQPSSTSGCHPFALLKDVHGMATRYPFNLEENSWNIFLFISAMRSVVLYYWYLVGSDSPKPLLINENSDNTTDNQ